MWTKDNRAKYERTGLRYPSDLTDEKWALIEPFLPSPRRVDRRSLVDGVLYVCLRVDHGLPMAAR